MTSCIPKLSKITHITCCYQIVTNYLLICNNKIENLASGLLMHEADFFQSIFWIMLQLWQVEGIDQIKFKELNDYLLLGYQFSPTACLSTEIKAFPCLAE